MVELEQLLYCKVMDRCKAGDLSKEQNKASQISHVFEAETLCGMSRRLLCINLCSSLIYIYVNEEKAIICMCQPSDLYPLYRKRSPSSLKYDKCNALSFVNTIISNLIT
jgi:hypothetical protein